jgi:hypothetical protein
MKSCKKRVHLFDCSLIRGLKIKFVYRYRYETNATNNVIKPILSVPDPRIRVEKTLRSGGSKSNNREGKMKTLTAAIIPRIRARCVSSAANRFPAPKMLSRERFTGISSSVARFSVQISV